MYVHIHTALLTLPLQNTLMSELKTRVEELKMENEYQLRLKEMNHSDKIKEMTDKSVQEMDALKSKLAVSLSQGVDQRLTRTHTLQYDYDIAWLEVRMYVSVYYFLTLCCLAVLHCFS